MPAFSRLFVGLAVVMGPAIDVLGGGSVDMDSPEAREAITKAVTANTHHQMKRLLFVLLTSLLLLVMPPANKVTANSENKEFRTVSNDF